MVSSGNEMVFNILTSRIFAFFFLQNLLFQFFDIYCHDLFFFPNLGARKPPLGFDNSLKSFIGHGMVFYILLSKTLAI